MYNLNNFKSKWIGKIKQILVETGRMDIWLNQNNLQIGNRYVSVKRNIKQTLLDQNLQKWTESLGKSNKGRSYSICKDTVQLESYLTELSKNKYINLIKFRTGNHRFPIETGRWAGLDVSERKCTLCDLHDVGDELHYLLKCKFFENERHAHIKRYYYTRPNIIKFKQLLNCKSKPQLISLCNFVTILLQIVR